ncbi:MAG: exlusion protein FxsA [Pseudohongiella sp.]|nr:exlusion protein FxsA [Pseudohongiella sp.]|tara:strand:+ start:185794 stop:186306 length:513 start_codon:yes stop_codon:yes gene_type:complete
MRIPFLALIVVPLAELYLLFAVADLIGGLATLALVILTAAVGLSVLRYQGFSTLNRANQRMAAGQLPGQEIVEGMMLAVAGALLLTPGLITDTIGFLLLTPVVRKRLAKRAISKGSGFFVGGFASGTRWQSGPSNSRGRGDIIDGEVVDRDAPPRDSTLEHNSDDERFRH